jgi:hypothetical protein
MRAARPVVRNVQLVYTHPSPLLVAQARHALERLGIPCVVHNEYAAGAAGELAPIDTWPELWVRRSRDAERARLAIERAQAAIEEADWTCRRCGSDSPATFDFCWHCGKAQHGG